MKVLDNAELELVSGGMPKGIDLAAAIAGGAAADLAGGIVGGIVGVGVAAALEFNLTNSWAASAVNDAYETGASL